MFQAKLLKFDAPLSTEEIVVAMQYEKTWMTRAEIAKKLGCSKSPALIKVINQAVAEGQIVFTITKMPNGVDCYHYSLPNDAYEEEGHVTSRGQVIFSDV